MKFYSFTDEQFHVIGCEYLALCSRDHNSFMKFSQEVTFY